MVFPGVNTRGKISKPLLWFYRPYFPPQLQAVPGKI